MQRSRPQTALSPKKSPTKQRNTQFIGTSTIDYEQILGDQQHQMSMQISDKEIEIERLKTTVVALNGKVQVSQEHEEDVKNAVFRFNDSENNRGQLQEGIIITSTTVQQNSEEHSMYQDELIATIDDLQKQLEAEKQRYYQRDVQFRSEKDEMQSRFHQELQSLNIKMEEVRSRLQKEKEEVRFQLSTENEQMRLQKDTKIKQLEDEFEAYRVKTNQTITTQDIKIKQFSQKILNLETVLISKNELIAKKSDVELQLDQARIQISQLANQKDNIQKELENATDYILELEEKVYKANKTSLELLKQLKDAEVEIETLKQYIVDLKQRIAVYIPVKEDGTDKKLAEFINNYPERSKLKIMFMRESEGVYQFGTKRVAVKVEKDNIKIRVGGGYLSIDEFLDQYTPVELEKLERKDPLKRFSEKVSIQKTIVNAGVRESSPVRQVSPGRKVAV